MRRMTWLFLCVLALPTKAATICVPGWQPLPPLPEPKEQHGCEAVGDVVYVIAGLTAGKQHVPTSYALAGGSWHRIADYPLAIQSPVAEVLNGTLYIVGGYDSRDPTTGKTSAVYAYDPKSDVWMKKAALNVAREDHGGAVADGKLYVFGGVGNPGHAMPDSYEIYDPLQNHWELHPWHQSRALGDFACEVNGQIEFATGVVSMAHYPRLTGLCYTDVASWGGALVIVGGCRINTNTPEANVRVWDRTPLPDYPFAVRSAGVAVSGDNLIVTGGWDGQRARTDCYVFTNSAG